jgi:hypothetical protein
MITLTYGNVISRAKSNTKPIRSCMQCHTSSDKYPEGPGGAHHTENAKRNLCSPSAPFSITCGERVDILPGRNAEFV